MSNQPDLINGGTLRTGTPKINKAIEDAFYAKQESTQAILDSTAALDIANQANEKSDFTQIQLDTIAGASTIDPAVEQMTVDLEGVVHPSPDARLRSELEKRDAQLAENVLDYVLMNKQTKLLGYFINKLKKNNNFTILCQGDSTTFGLGSSNGTSYPSALQEYLNQIYVGKATVIKQGFSGDDVKKSYNRWTTPVTSDLTIFSFGINDAEYIANLDEFIDYYRLLIRRELNNNSAVILLTSAKQQSANREHFEAYRQVIYTLSKEYKLPVFDLEEMTANCDASYFYDGWHYNDKGYRFIGAKIASLFIGSSLIEPFRVGHGSVLLTRPTIDNLKLISGTSFLGTGNQWTPTELTTGSIAVDFVATGKACYSFYCDTPNLVLTPHFYLFANSEVKFSVNFGLEQPQHSLQTLIDGVASPTLPPTKPNQNLTLTSAGTAVSYHEFSNKQELVISQKGWVSIMVEQVSGTGRLFGLSFANYGDKAITSAEIVTVTRDLTLTGTQTITTLVNKPIKSMRVIGAVNGSKKICEGMWANNVATGNYVDSTTGNTHVTNVPIVFSQDSAANRVAGNIQSVTRGSFSIAWTILSGTGTTGTATLNFLIEYA